MKKAQNVALAIGFTIAALVIARRGQQNTGSAGIGRTETFPVDGGSSEHVEGVAYEMLQAAITDERVEILAEQVLKSYGKDFAPSYDAAWALHDFVNNRVPTKPDPENFEYMTDPGTVSDEIRSNGHLPHLDCDDKGILLASLYRSVGFNATVCFMDIDGDGQIDHAMTLVDIPGQGPTYAETTVPGKPLGWAPKYAFAECLVLEG